MIIAKRFLAVFLCALMNCGYAICEEKTDVPFKDVPKSCDQDDGSPSSKKISREEAYEALDKDNYDKLRTLITDKDVVEDMFIMAAEKSSPKNSQKALFLKRFNEDKEKEKVALQKDLAECRAASQWKDNTYWAFVGAGISVIGIGSTVIVMKILKYIE